MISVQATTRRRRRALSSLLSLSLSVAMPSFATDSAPENARLAALLRQLDLLERLARESTAVALSNDTRYHFDYSRLHADIARMRAGIEDYLSPRRAQPRDPNALNGAYRRETSATP